MNERVLRWKGRIASLKLSCGIILVFAVLVACAGIANLRTALKNPGASQTVTLVQLVDGEVETGRYVSISGLAAYDLGYEKAANDKTTAIYYFLIDPDRGATILVKHRSVQLATQQSDPITITGMTRSTPADLKAAIMQDERRLAAHGQTTTHRLYVEDGALPPKEGRAFLTLVTGVIMVSLCLAALFLPRIVFVPYPLATTATQPDSRSRVRATGAFTQLKSVEPLAVGTRVRAFNNAVANIIPLGERELLIYIQYILKTKTYGITARTTTTDWGVHLHSDQDVVAMSGKLLGWKDAWAARVQYPTARGKPATLYIIFEDAGAQAAFMDLLRARHFAIRKRLRKFQTTPG